MVMVTDQPISPEAAYHLVKSDGSGSVVFHFAVVKASPGDRGVTSSIEYREKGDTGAELESIAAELMNRWELDDVVLVRRTGRLGVGEIISLVAASSPNSADAFQSCQDGIGRLKKMATIVKTEVFG